MAGLHPVAGAKVSLALPDGCGASSRVRRRRPGAKPVVARHVPPMGSGLIQLTDTDVWENSASWSPAVHGSSSATTGTAVPS